MCRSSWTARWPSMPPAYLNATPSISTTRRDLIRSGQSPLRFPGLKMVGSATVAGDQRSEGPAIIMASSGMCTNGHQAPRDRTSSGPSRPSSSSALSPRHLGRQLLNGNPGVRIHGLQWRASRIAQVQGFSGHAVVQLLRWLGSLHKPPPPLHHPRRRIRRPRPGQSHSQRKAWRVTVPSICRRSSYVNRPSAPQPHPFSPALPRIFTGGHLPGVCRRISRGVWLTLMPQRRYRHSYFSARLERRAPPAAGMGQVQFRALSATPRSFNKRCTGSEAMDFAYGPECVRKWWTIVVSSNSNGIPQALGRCLPLRGREKSRVDAQAPPPRQ